MRHPPLTNRPDGYSFDAAGNMLGDGTNTLSYDDENRLVSVNGTGGTYTYDDNGLRVQKVASGTPTVYIFSGGQLVAEYDNGAVPSSPTREYIDLGGPSAMIEGGSTTYYHWDHLSVRVLTDANGNIIGQRGHYPFGETWYETGTTTKWKFTSYERDTESGNDYAQARHYLNRFGRFLHPDPLGNFASDRTNSQTWNLYTYALNSPLTFLDPDGRECVWDDGSYDSNNDPQSGSPDQCGALGGSWIGHDIFANSQYYQGDWSGAPDGTLSNLVADIQSCSAAAGGGQATSLLVADAFASGFSNNQTAYLLATAAWESGPGGIGNHMTEMGGAAYFARYDGRMGNTNPGDGALYRGRGYVQVTGKTNYQTWSNELSVDLVKSPGLAATPDIAAQIAVEGMDRGKFRSNLSLYDFVNPGGTDFFNARGVINGDKNFIRPGGTISNGTAIANSATAIAGALAGCR